eukprot:5057277-Prymnesium_polylepis.1
MHSTRKNALQLEPTASDTTSMSGMPASIPIGNFQNFVSPGRKATNEQAAATDTGHMVTHTALPMDIIRVA